MTEKTHERIQSIIDGADVVLFMKGVPAQPQCGFSAAVVQVLNGVGVKYDAVNVLADPFVREGIKAYSNWPTIPQLYVKGEFIGGCDIVREMAASGELTQLFSEKGVEKGVGMSTETATIADVPQLYKRHVFACYTQRPAGHPRGSCGAQGAQPLWDRLAKKLEAERLPDIGFTASGCLGFCNAGPLMVVYPEGIWYAPKAPEDIDEIVETHLKGGQLVDRLVVVLAR